jgi:hypothetical protein
MRRTSVDQVSLHDAFAPVELYSVPIGEPGAQVKV